MKLSVILPVYNAEKFVAKAIQSVLNQTYKDFELIVINDGSKDNSLKIIQSFTDERIRLIDQENQGLAKTLNIGLELAQGNYIARMDADDICLKHRFQEQMTYLKKHPDIGLLGTAVEIIDENDKHLSYHAPYIGHDKLVQFMNQKGNPFKHPTVMFKREIALRCGGFNEHIGKYFEDYFLWNLIAEKAKIDNLPKVLLKYRISSGSIMSTLKNKELDQLVLEVIKKKKFTDEDKNEMNHIFEKIKANEVKVQRKSDQFGLKFYKLALNTLYPIMGNTIVNIASKIKSSN
ncbi:Glycosyl transferase family 2 [Paenimyroides aquimaris]|uniref:Glycosyl transferase family 2 n=1 Tax=Paenimyroides marinum TaxID=1159016 RepID=A0A1H6JFH7_9FLAO|nr:glycosyltransferase [Paenimyroides aquimaris]SEH57646.1 Glycosyl transferase family 2 [Paenimyroides aquimaris]